MRFASMCLVLLVGSSGFAGSASYLCQMAGEVRDSCCCPHEEEGAAGHDEIARDDACCELFAPETDRLPVALQASGSDAEPPEAAPVQGVEVPPLAARERPTPSRARAPPGSKSPLFVWKSSYLI